METKIDSEVTKTPGTETFNTMYSESDSEKSLGSYEIKEQINEASSTTEDDDSVSYFERKPSSLLSKNTSFTPPILEKQVKLDIENSQDMQPSKDNTFIDEDQSTTSFSLSEKDAAISSSNNDNQLPFSDINERKMSYRLSTISLSDMNDVPLLEDNTQPTKTSMEINETEKSFNPLKMITAALVDGGSPETASKPAPTPLSFLPSTSTIYKSTHPLDSEEDNNEEASIASPTRSIFTIFSSFRSSSSNNTTPTSSRRPSKQTSLKRPSIISTTRPISVISPLPGFQEALLAQMEQLNQANTNDPKSTVLKQMERRSIRQSLVLQNNNSSNNYDWDFWASVMCDYQSLTKSNKELIKQIQCGVPPSIRGMVWQVLSRCKNEDLATTYKELIKQTSPYEKLILRDLSRTFPGHQYFNETEGRESLYHVVKAYSVYDKKVGYCQGLGFIVGPILLNMPEEDAFCLLVQLMNKYELRGHFTPDMNGLHLKLYQFDALVQEHLPHVARHMKQQEITSTMYASQWFITLFAYKFPLSLVYRIYDVVFAEGMTSILKFAIALLKKNERTIIGLDFDELLDFLKNGLFEEYKDDDVQLVNDACELEISTKTLVRLEKEYKIKLEKDTADAAVIEELQKSNLDIQQQLKLLGTKMDVLKYEHNDINIQLQRTVNRLHALKEEGVSLRTFMSTVEGAIATLPHKIAAETREKHKHVFSENAELVEKNAMLEDRLQAAEMELINIKMQYAESENEKEEMHKRLFEFKKLMSF